MHFYCTKCETYLGTEEKSYNCSGCKLQMDFQECKKARCFFMTSSIANQLRDMLEGTTLFSKISAGKQHMGKDKKAEILTGDGYKDPKIQKFLAVKENFSMTFSSDGVNVFNSNKDSLWPIFLSINELNFKFKSKHILMQGLWFRKKPNQRTFLRPFILEAKDLYEEGFSWNNNGTVVQSQIMFLIGVLDAPARAAFTCQHQWNGNCGCGWCLHPGESVVTLDKKGRPKGNTRTYRYTKIVPEKRTARQVFRDGKMAQSKRSRKAHVNGVLGLSLLHLLPHFDIVRGMIPDTMHAVYLGITKMFLEIWLTIPGKCFSLSKRDIDNSLKSLKPPLEIARMYRSLEKNFADWKASEFRNFLLVYSPVVLKKTFTF